MIAHSLKRRALASISARKEHAVCQGLRQQSVINLHPDAISEIRPPSDRVLLEVAGDAKAQSGTTQITRFPRRAIGAR